MLECAIDPAHQSKGIGSALLQHVLRAHRWVVMIVVYIYIEIAVYWMLPDACLVIVCC